jgi:hypothetical protein
MWLMVTHSEYSPKSLDHMFLLGSNLAPTRLQILMSVPHARLRTS